jgi:tetratricopeptide (TPR) repeat protein
MKRIALLVFFLVLTTLSFSQTQSEVLERRYNMLVSQVGEAGLGVETLLNAWEKEEADNLNMLIGKFRYYFIKGQSTQVVARQERKYLGMEPILSLKDSLGRQVCYFQEYFYDDELYGQAIKALDRAVSHYPDRLDLRFMKANALLAYEKGSPDMTLDYLLKLTDEAAARTKDWTYGAEKKDKSFFEQAIQEYCYNLFAIGTTASKDAFMTLSVKLNKIFPSNLDFLNNIGSYHLANSDFKDALKIYSKVLKKQSDNLTAIQNCVLASRLKKDVKAEMKYLQMMVKYAPEQEALVAKNRIETLSKN